VNPNTSVDSTIAMVEIAQIVADPWTVTGLTARSGAAFIDTPAKLEEAALAVETLATGQEGIPCAGILIAAFGDPGIEALRRQLPFPVCGIGEASLRAAGTRGRSLAIVTTTPKLETSLWRQVEQAGLAGQCKAVLFTDAPMHELATEDALKVALMDTCERVLARHSVDVVVIAGGPLARAARAFAHLMPVPVIDPVTAGVRQLIDTLERKRNPAAPNGGEI